MKIEILSAPAANTQRGRGLVLVRTLLVSGLVGLCALTTAGSSSAQLAGARVMPVPQSTAQPARAAAHTWQSVPTLTIKAGELSFAYRELGQQNGGTPIVFFWCTWPLCWTTGIHGSWTASHQSTTSSHSTAVALAHPAGHPQIPWSRWPTTL